LVFQTAERARVYRRAGFQLLRLESLQPIQLLAVRRTFRVGVAANFYHAGRLLLGRLQSERGVARRGRRILLLDFLSVGAREARRPANRLLQLGCRAEKRIHEFRQQLFGHYWVDHYFVRRRNFHVLLSGYLFILRIDRLRLLRCLHFSKQNFCPMFIYFLLNSPLHFFHALILFYQQRLLLLGNLLLAQTIHLGEQAILNFLHFAFHGILELFPCLFFICFLLFFSLVLLPL